MLIINVSQTRKPFYVGKYLPILYGKALVRLSGSTCALKGTKFLDNDFPPFNSFRPMFITLSYKDVGYRYLLELDTKDCLSELKQHFSKVNGGLSKSLR